jgi:hypothetical protein
MKFVLQDPDPDELEGGQKFSFVCGLVYAYVRYNQSNARK